MSLLDDLKKKAEQLKTDEQSRSEHALRNVVAVDDRLRKIFSYLDELGKTLTVIKPEVAKPYVLGSAGKFEGLRQSDHFADYRLGNIHDRECYESVTFLFKNVAVKESAIAFDDALLADRFEKMLWEHNVSFKRDDVLNEQRKITKVNFRVPHEVRSELSFEGKHEAGVIKIVGKNIGRFGQDELAFEAGEIDTAWLDELAKFIITEPNRFKLMGKRQQINIPHQPVELPVPEYEIHQTPEEEEKPQPSGLVGTVKGLWQIWKK
jgi:hypothetical protein